jgi:hypothetical protein
MTISTTNSTTNSTKRTEQRVCFSPEGWGSYGGQSFRAMINDATDTVTIQITDDLEHYKDICYMSESRFDEAAEEIALFDPYRRDPAWGFAMLRYADRCVNGYNR